MPTGYTSALYNGEEQTFEEFALDCARAFAWWHRDSSAETLADAPVQDTYQGFARDSELKLALLEIQTPEQYTAEHAKEVERVRLANAETARKNAELAARYHSMLRRVKAWTPPTEKHQGLKDFMIDQLQSSIDHDCDEWVQKITLDPEEWHRSRIDHERKMIARYREEAEKEVERNASNAKWVATLRANLEQERGKDDPRTETAHDLVEAQAGA